jgi:hypothetical protein
MVDSIDRITIPGIMFVSIHVDTSNADIDDIDANIAFEPEQPEITLQEETFWRSGEIVEVEGLIDGFVRFSADVGIVSQTSTTVQFTVPFGIDRLTVSTKDNGDLVVLEDKEIL